MKKCGHCGEIKPKEAFAKNSPSQRSRTGLKSWCRSCTASGYLKWKAEHPEHKEKKKVASHRWYSENRERHATSQLKNRYGITPTQRAEMLTMQGDACAICHVSFSEKRVSIDHDHKTGRARGLLCARCNNWLAAIEDEKFLASALAYLKRRFGS